MTFENLACKDGVDGEKGLEILRPLLWLDLCESYACYFQEVIISCEHAHA